MAEEHESNYGYNANFGAAVLFAVLYGLSLLYHLYQAFSYRTRFMLPLLIAATMETFGYVFRGVTIKNPDPLWVIIISETFLVVSPAFLAAQDYMIIGRVMAYVGSEFSYIRHERITKLFVAADIIAILTQASGGSMLAQKDSIDTLRVARYILITGLTIQVLVFTVFWGLATIYHFKAKKALGPAKLEPLKKLWLAFYIGAFLITARSIYRLIEFASIRFELNNDEPQGYLITHEWCLYVLDTLPMFIMTVLYNLYHPGQFLPAKKGLRLDGTYEVPRGRRKYLCCGARKSRKPDPELIDRHGIPLRSQTSP
ncbi:hypothetical protein FRC03_001418 [Tulasnella sp. 419]|nr:hypothetical protein FRC02_000733 [Tulasnella sp. 418]KAG8964739.1 hypothetical protein FRC03_001418 [Tulasnella sp. 419]